MAFIRNYRPMMRWVNGFNYSVDGFRITRSSEDDWKMTALVDPVLNGDHTYQITFRIV